MSWKIDVSECVCVFKVPSYELEDRYECVCVRSQGVNWKIDVSEYMCASSQGVSDETGFSCLSLSIFLFCLPFSVRVLVTIETKVAFLQCGSTAVYE